MSVDAIPEEFYVASPRRTKKRPVIAIDLDEVLYPFTESFVPWLITHGYLDESRANEASAVATDEELAAILGVSIGKMHELNHSFLNEDGKFIEPIEGAVEELTRLSRETELYVVTARAGWLEAITRRWIDVNFHRVFSEVYFTGPTKEHSRSIVKGAVCDDIRAVVMVDDNPEHLNPLPAITVPVLYGKTPWSEGSEVDAVPMASWSNAGDFFENILASHQFLNPLN